MIITNKNLTEKTLQEIFEIHKEKLGESFTSFSKLKNDIKNEKIVAYIENNICKGFLIFNIMSENDFFKNRKLDIVGSDEPVFIFSTIAVKEEKKGIGSKIIQYCLENLITGIHKLYVPIWKSKKGANSKPLFEKFGFNLFSTIENFWYEDSLGKENYCPVCNSPCHCSLLIYNKQL